MCETTAAIDPIVLYDHLADRWLMSYIMLISEGPPSLQYFHCIAVSQTSDPTGAWHRYAFLWGGKYNDYAKVGVWPDGYYVSANQLDPLTFDPEGVGVAAFERAEMLNGNSADMVLFDLETMYPTVFGMLPADLDGPSPPGGTPNYFATVDMPADEFEIWAFDVDWSTPTSSTFTPLAVLPTTPFDPDLCPAFREQCIDQPNTPTKLEAISDRLMHRLQYRNFGSYQALVANHTVDAVGAGRAGIRWYELRDDGSGWTIHQQGTYTPDTDHRWMGSIAMNADGSIALGYTVSSTATFPSIRITGRAADAPLGMLNAAEQTLINGSGSQTRCCRWGDYSMMAVDPVDDQTFRYAHEYYGAAPFNDQTFRYAHKYHSTTPGDDWRTRVGSFNATPADVTLTNETITGTRYYEAENSITASTNVTIASGSNTTFRVDDNGTIVLQPGFSAVSGSTFRAYISAGTSPHLAEATARPAVQQSASEEDVASEAERAPTSFSLAQNYPNPFNPTTEIHFSLPEAVRVSLVVYDVTGREVARLVDDWLEAGTHRLRFDASHLASGLYLYRIVAGDVAQSKTMVLLK